MNMRFTHSRRDYVLPFSLPLLVALLVQFTLPGTTGFTDPLLLFSAAFYTGIFLLLMYDGSCELTPTEFTETSYFFLRKTIPISDIIKLAFPSSFAIIDETRSLVIAATHGRNITMPDVAYTRPVLAQAANALIAANRHIEIDADVRTLLELNAPNS